MKSVLAGVGCFAIGKTIAGLLSTPILLCGSSAALAYAAYRAGPIINTVRTTGYYKSSGRWWEVEIKKSPNENIRLYRVKLIKTTESALPAALPAERAERKD